MFYAHEIKDTIAMSDLLSDKSIQFYCNICITFPLDDDRVEIKTEDDIAQFFDRERRGYMYIHVDNINHAITLTHEFHLSNESDVENFRRIIMSFLKSDPLPEDLKNFSITKRYKISEKYVDGLYYSYDKLRAEAIAHARDNCAGITAAYLGAWCHSYMNWDSDAESMYYELGDHYILREKFDVPDDYDWDSADDADEFMYYEIDTKI